MIKKLSISLLILLFTSAMASAEEVYVNEELGFSIVAPKDWHKHIISPGSMGTQYGGVAFTKSPELFIFPQLNVIVDFLREDMQHIKTAMDFAEFIVPYMKDVAERKGGSYMMVEEPHEINIDDIRAARFIVDRVGTEGKSLRIIDCKFIKEDLIISLQGMDWSSSFEINLRDFEEAINSFKFLE